MLPENRTDWARILETDKLAARRERTWIGELRLSGNRMRLCKWRKWDEVTEIGRGQVWDGVREEAGCMGITDQIQGNAKKNLSCSGLPCRMWNGTQGSGALLFCCCWQM